jgi:hypothetical protein
LYIQAGKCRIFRDIGSNLAGKTPLTIIKEAIYTKLLELPEKGGQFTNFELDADVTPLQLKELFGRYVSRFGSPPGLNSSEDFKKLRLEMAAAIRHKDCDLKLCYQVVFQSLEKGLPYVLAAAGREARILKQLSKEVSLEISQNKSLVFKYNVDTPSIIYTYCNLIHNTADIILKYYVGLYPEKTILIYTRREAFWVKENNFGNSDLTDFNRFGLYGSQLATV